MRKHVFGFIVDSEQTDYYFPEGELQINDTAYFCKSYFIRQTNQLDIGIYPTEFEAFPDDSRDRNAAVVSIDGECDFSDESFVFTVDKISGNAFMKIGQKPTFHKVALE